MKKQNTNVPKLRFSSFHDEWELHQIKELFQITRGKVLSISLIKSEKDDQYQYPVYSSQVLNHGLVGYYHQYLFENIITWTTDGINAGTVYYHPERCYCTNVCGVLISNQYNNQCVASIIDRATKKYVIKSCIPKLMNNVMSRIKIWIPKNLLEQTCISNLLSQFDHLITLYQRKYEKLINIKKSLLEKIFSLNNKNTFKIRFNDFHDEWKECKLGELCSITTGKLDVKVAVKNGKYDLYTCGKTKYKVNSYEFEGPAITIAGNGSVGYMQLADGKFNAYQRTYVLQKFKKDRIFLFYEINNKLTQIIYKEVKTSCISFIFIGMLTNLKIHVPSLPEQTCIANLLSQFDHLITLNQRKYEKLINIKKSLLEKMFV